MEAGLIRVLIAEDSAVTRELLQWVLSDDPRISVVGTARDGQDAVEKVRALRPDVVLMDVTMPRLDGYEATRQIMESTPVPIVMISSGFDKGGVASTFASLSAGAVAVVEKPVGGQGPEQVASARQLLETVLLMAEIKVVRRWAKRTGAGPKPSPPPVEARPAEKIHRKQPLEIAAIGASTGGPAVLAEILGGQRASFPVPILVVQHIAHGFAAGLAAWLDDQTELRVKLAEPYERVQPGIVYVAPDDRQMGLATGGRIHLTEEPAEAGFRPSISHTFRSAAAHYGPAAAGVLLTGMGHDGAEGLLQIRDAGGLTFVQDEATSVVFGMAAQAIRLGAAEHVLSPAEIARLLRSIVPSPAI
jgi:two-component system chemotaxis response regulator CheB